MEISELKIPDSYLITLDPNTDHRGYFMRLYDENVFSDHGLVTKWVQENESLSRKPYTLRGLHYQEPPHAETKLIRVSSGSLYDVFVDLRKNSDMFGKWESVRLKADEHKMVYIPKGCAHGFCSLEKNTRIEYKVDSFYAPDHEGGIYWKDDNLNIDWPTDDPVLSEKDRTLPEFSEIDFPF